jgi:clan AA aspartic protease (TIGR02281 family)
MKNKLALICTCLSILLSTNLYAQSNSEEKIQDALYTLKDYVRDWSCDRFLEGSFTENLKISLKDGKLIFQSNFSLKDAEFFAFPEYTKAIIDLSMIRSVKIQENDNKCAGIQINTKVNGIQILEKFRNSNSEVPMAKQVEFLEEIGWVNDAIRLSKNSYFEERSTKVVNIIKEIAILSGNKLLEEARIIINAEPSNQNLIQMKNIGGVSIIPCKVNGLNLNFIFDTGASNVSISMTEASFMFKNGYLEKSDIIGSSNFLDANGNINEGVLINLKEIEIGTKKIFNVRANVIKNNKAPLLLGQSAIKKLGELKIDLQNNTLEIFSGDNTNSQLNTNTKNDIVSNNPIIGLTKKIGNIEVAQFDLSNLYTWIDAKKACDELGSGWRLPTKDELNTLYKNKSIIGGFKDFPYWSSTEYDSNQAWYQIFDNGRQVYYQKAQFPVYVRAVRSF